MLRFSSPVFMFRKQLAKVLFKNIKAEKCMFPVQCTMKLEIAEEPW